MKIAGLVSCSGCDSGQPRLLVPGRKGCVEKNRQTVCTMVYQLLKSWGLPECSSEDLGLGTTVEPR